MHEFSQKSKEYKKIFIFFNYLRARIWKTPFKNRGRQSFMQVKTPPSKRVSVLSSRLFPLFFKNGTKDAEHFYL
jgi:hypothetical protein